MPLDQELTQHALYIGQLLHKEADRQPLTEKERADLDAWRDGSQRRMDISREVKDQASVAHELDDLNRQYNPDRAIHNILRSSPPKKKFLWLWPAAAALLLVIGAAWLFTNRTDKAGPVVAVAPSLPMTPGQKKYSARQQ